MRVAHQGYSLNFSPLNFDIFSPQETHVLPEIVNIVYTVTFESPYFKEPLNLVRLAQYLPNVKYRPPGFASVTIRIYPTTALLSMKGKLVLIRCTTRNMALFYSHYYRQLVEQVSIIMKGPNPEDKPYVGKLEGYLGFSIGEIQNMVGNGVLPQDGVHLTRLLYSDQEAVDWDPGGFPNLIYNARLPNGKPFCANIAITGKIVLMGLKDIEDVYSSYKIMCNVVHDFDDPNVPTDPKERYKYRLKQLENDPQFISTTNEAAMAELPRMNDADFLENLGKDVDESLGDDEDNGLDLDAILAPVKVKNEPKATIFRLDDDDDGEDDDEPLLFKAALSGQVDNVRFILTQPGMALSAFTKNSETGGYTILEKLEPLTSANHRQIHHLVEEFIANKGK